MNILKDLRKYSNDPVTSILHPSPVTMDQKGPEEHSPLIQVALSFDVLSFISLKLWSGGPLRKSLEIIGVTKLMRQGCRENQNEAFSATGVLTLCL